jgi:hypothetical protein
MNALEKNIAVVRGEALAAQLLASAAIQFAATMVPNRREFVAGLSAFVDDTLNRSRPNKGDPDDDFNTQMRETARHIAMQHIDAIARGGGA